MLNLPSYFPSLHQASRRSRVDISPEIALHSAVGNHLHLAVVTSARIGANAPVGAFFLFFPKRPADDDG